MSKRPKNRRSKGGPASRPRSGAAFGIHSSGPGRDGGTDGESELNREIERRLHRGPLDFLTHASLMAAVLEPDPLSRRRPSPASLDEFITMLRSTGGRATDALLLVMVQFTGNDLLVQRVGREVAARGHRFPDWLMQLDRTRPVRALSLGHVLGDGENVLVEVEGPAAPLTLMLYIDHNLGTVVKDGYALDMPFDEVAGRLRELAEGEAGVIETSLTLADARARIDRAVAVGRTVYPPIETDSWPAARPFTEWMLRLMPGGGTGYSEQKVGDVAIETLVDRLAADPVSDDFDAARDSDDRDIAFMLMRLAADELGGDPLRWSPVTVEILLADLVPRKVRADEDYLARVPDVMRNVVVFAHGERGIPDGLTSDTLRAVDDYEPDYREAIGADDGGSFVYDDDWYRTKLASAVGGEDAMDSLDLSPLPVESLSLEGVPEDIREKVGVVSALAGDAAEELFGAELRTAAQRVLTRVAARDPAIFRRNSKVEMTAAAVLWIAATANESLRRDHVSLKEMMARLGVSGSPSQRAETMLRALGCDDAYGWAYHGSLGDPALLVSARREDLHGRWERVNEDSEFPGDD